MRWIAAGVSIVMWLAAFPDRASAGDNCQAMPAGPSRTDCYIALSRLHGAHHAQKISAPDFFYILCFIAAMDQLFRDLGKSGDIGAIGQSSSSIKIAADTHIVNSDMLYHVVDMIDSLGYGSLRWRIIPLDGVPFFPRSPAFLFLDQNARAHDPPMCNCCDDMSADFRRLK